MCGFNKSTFLTEDGKLFACGVGEPAQLGFYGPCHRPVPLLVGFPQVFPPKNFTMISAGANHYAALCGEGSVWTWGKGRYGVLGHGDDADRVTPTRLHKTALGESPAVMVACGWHHTMVVTADCKLWTFGSGSGNYLLQVLRENLHAILVPRLVLAFSAEVNISMVSGGKHHSIGATSGGDVFTWGWAQHGALGHNQGQQFEEKLLPSMLDRALFGGSRVVFVAAGEHNSAAVTEKGLLYVWGYGAYGQLGLGDDENKLIPTCISKGAFDGAMVSMVSLSSYRSLAVTEDGRLWSWGLGSEGSLGHNNELDIFIPTCVDQEYFDGAKVVTAAVGCHVLTAVTEDGALYSCGKAIVPYEYKYTGLGHTDIEDKLVPTRVDPKFMQGSRVGRWHDLLPEHALAFAMGSHSRLGGSDNKHKECSPVSMLDDNLVNMVVGLCRDSTAGGCLQLPGVLRLMGGSVK